jgi:long-subunit fatty acid transport protein
MKKIFTLILAAAVSGQLFAGGIVTNTNQSAQFVRMLSRNASTQIDAVYFNPAGLIRMDDGFHFSLNNQTIFQEKTVTSTFPGLNNDTYIGDVAVPFFPSFFAAYKQDKLALSFGFGPNGGGGSAEYLTGLPSFEMPISMIPTMLTSNGVPTTQYAADIYFNGSSVFWGAQVGATYAINDVLSVSAGIRIIMAKNVYEGHLQNIQINPNQPAFGTNYNGSNMVLANQFFNDAALALNTWSAGATSYYTGLQPLVDGGAGTTLLANGAAVGLTSDQVTQIQQLLGAAGLSPTDIGGIDIQTAQATLGAAAPVLAGKASAMSDNAVATADMKVDATQTGTGYTPYFGANINLNDKINIGIKYEMNTKLELTNKADADKDAGGMFLNDSTFRSDIPAILALGIEYKVMDDFRVSASWTHYFDKNADWNGKEEFVDDNLYEVALGMEYDVSEKITLSAGFLHGQTGVGQGYQTDISFSNSSNTVGFGGRLNVSEQLSIDLGALITMYTSASEEKIYNELIPYKETYDKSLMDFAIGVNYKF